MAKIEKKTVKQAGRIYTYYYQLTGTSRVRITREEYTESRAAQTKIIGKAGKLTKVGQTYLNQLKRDFESGGISAEDYYLITYEIRKSIAQKKARTQAQIGAVVSRNKLTIALANTGLAPESLARTIGVDVSVLLNLSNWEQKTHYGRSRRGNVYAYTTIGDVFTDPNTGKSYKLIYVYNGDTHFEAVTA